MIFRRTLDELIESLDATVRVSRWVGSEEAPAPLHESASRLVARLGTADRLGSAKFSGSVADAARVTAMVSAMRRLDTAYVAFRAQLQSGPSDREVAAVALGAELDEVKASAAWAG